MVKEFPIDLMDEIVRKIIKSQEESDFGYVLLYNEYLEFLHRVLLDSKRDPEEVAAKIRNLLGRKKIKLSSKLSAPLGPEYELFRRINKDSERPYSDFKNLLYTEISRSARTEETRYSVAYALNFALEEEIRLNINEIPGLKKRRYIPFEMIPYSAFESTLSAQNVSQETQRRQIEQLQKMFNDQFSFCVFNDVYGRDEEFIIDYCERKLASIMGLLTLSFGGRVTFGSKPKPVGILLSHALVFKNGDYVNYYFFGENKAPASFEKVDHANIEHFTEFLSLFNQIKSKGILIQLSDALASYFEASLEDDMASAYLKYWVCIENCLQASAQDKIIKILKGLPFWRQDLYIKHQILLMPQIRNQYVHELKTEVSQFDRNFVHKVVGNLIRYILRNGSKFRDKNELDLFLELVSREDTTYLQGHKKMAELARKEIEDYRRSNITS